jgi:hypothetical protein
MNTHNNRLRGVVKQPLPKPLEFETGKNDALKIFLQEWLKEIEEKKGKPLPEIDAQSLLALK